MAITTDIDWPSDFPKLIRENYGVQHGTPFVRTTMDSGRVRQRKKFSLVPSSTDVSWIFTSEQCAYFEAWFRDELNDGASWFNIPLVSPLGLNSAVCRFSEMYSGPNPIGLEHFQVNAKLEVFERQIIPVEFKEFPEFYWDRSIFDVAMNREWPE